MIRLALLALLVLVLVLGITNPGQDAHRQAVVASMATTTTNSQVVGRIAADLLGDIDVLPLEYHNYFLFSTTTMNGKTRSIGVCSRVWQVK